MIPELVRNYTAGADVAANLIVKMGADDTHVVAAAAATDGAVGISTNINVANGQPCDVIHGGIADVKAGGAIARGDLVTADAAGKAVTAAPGAGVNNRIIGVALASAVANDIIPVLVFPSSIQGA